MSSKPKPKMFDGTPWTPLPLDLIESDAWRSLGSNGFRLLFFLMREHMRHGGKENGKLKAPRKQLREAGGGLSSRRITATIAQAEEIGLIECRRNGLRAASTYALTWLPRHDGTPASDRWRSYRNPNLAPLPAPKSRNLGDKGNPALGDKGNPDGMYLGDKGNPDGPRSLGDKGNHLSRISLHRRDSNDVYSRKVAAQIANGHTVTVRPRRPPIRRLSEILKAKYAVKAAPSSGPMPTDPLARMAYLNMRAAR